MSSTLESFLHRLLQSQLRLQQAGIAHADPSLVLGEALLRYRGLRAGCGSLPVQIVVTGPTQAGKSSVVNWLLGVDAAGVNALAGYTRHAQGFSTVSLDAPSSRCMEQFFAGLKKTPRSQLSDQQLDAWSLEPLSGRSVLADVALIAWDSPDFDSVSSRSYRDVVLKLLALADVVLFVVSKEKYADQTVWNTLKLIQPLQLPLILCINKVPHESVDELRRSLQQRLQQERIQATVIDLPYLERLEGVDAMSERLLQAVKPELDRISGRRPVNHTDAFLSQYWAQWTAPVRKELEQQASWQHSVEAALDTACESYRENYLRGPLYAETLQQAVARLLELLEIPGLAGTLGRARHVLTWPGRKLRSLFSGGSALTPEGEQQSRESTVLNETVQQTLVSLQHTAVEHIAQPDAQSAAWWSALLNELNAAEPGLRHTLQEAIADYQARFAENIEQAAQELYRHLQQHPATLNSLRAARVSVDAAAVVLALKTGGVGLNDLVLTPAMLSFTHVLTESAVGQYMRGVEKRLKKAQQEAVCERLFRGVLQDALAGVPDGMSQQTVYGLSAAELEAAEREISHDDRQ